MRRHFDETMIRGTLTLFVFVSVIFFPWPLAAALAVILALFVPLVPLAAGLFCDTLYYTPAAGSWPLATLLGAVLTLAAFIVRNTLDTGIIGE